MSDDERRPTDRRDEPAENRPASPSGGPWTDDQTTTDRPTEALQEPPPEASCGARRRRRCPEASGLEPDSLWLSTCCALAPFKRSNSSLAETGQAGRLGPCNRLWSRRST